MSAKPSLYERIGGKEMVTSMVDAFYERVLADPLLEPFFRNVSMEKLRSMQYEFFSTALGGPVTYLDKTIYRVHYGLGIKRKHFARFVQHLLETLQSFDLDEDDISHIIGRVNTYVDEVLGGHGLDG